MTDSADENGISRAGIVRVALLSGLLGFGIAVLILNMMSDPDKLTVRFENSGNQRIESLKLDFGSADTQSSILALRIEPGESRTLALNHPVGAGFNVTARYENGREQSFCALRGDENINPTIALNL